MRTEANRVHSCPQCGGEVSRVHRSVRDRIVGLLEDVRRFRCDKPDCGWEGIISTDWMPHSVRTQLAMTWFGRLTWMVVGVAVAFAGMYALYAGLVFLVGAGLIFAPVVHRVMHKFHWEQ